MASKTQVWLKLNKLHEELEKERRILSNSRKTKKANGDLCELGRKLGIVSGFIESYPSSFGEAKDFLAREEKENRQPECRQYNFRKRAFVEYNNNKLHMNNKNNNQNQDEVQSPRPEAEVLSPSQEINCNKPHERENLRITCTAGGRTAFIEPKVMVTPMKRIVQCQTPVAINTPEVICLGVLEKPKPELIDLASPIRH